MSFSKTWDETSPDGNVHTVAQGDDEIRDMKTALRERLTADHNFKASEGGDTTIGMHKQIHLLEQSSSDYAANQLGLLAKEVNSILEIVMVKEDGTEVPMTKNQLPITSFASSIETIQGITASGAVALGSTLSVAGTATLSGTANLKGELQLNGSAGTSGQVLLSQGSGSDPIWGDNYSVYDSGWFSVSTNNSYTKTHSLGTTKCIPVVYISDSNPGSLIEVPSEEVVVNWGDAGVGIIDFDSTTITIATGSVQINHRNLSNPAWGSGYARIILIALT